MISFDCKLDKVLLLADASDLLVEIDVYLVALLLIELHVDILEIFIHFPLEILKT
jgi:hypothetical protein